MRPEIYAGNKSMEYLPQQLILNRPWPAKRSAKLAASGNIAAESALNKLFAVKNSFILFYVISAPLSPVVLGRLSLVLRHVCTARVVWVHVRTLHV